MAIILPTGKQQFFNPQAPGDFLVGGKVYTYEAGTTTPKATYADADETTPNANPVILDSMGAATIFWSGTYDVVIKDSDNNTVYEVDEISTVIDLADITYDGDTLSTILSVTPHTVTNIAALQAVDSTKYTLCDVLGYYAGNDGGGGLYWFDSGDTTTASNGGTVIVGADNARWKLQTFGQPVSVLQFGAKPDGVTDATAKFTAALGALGAGGGVVTALGTFYIATDLTIPANCKLQGFSTPTVRNDGQFQRANYESSLTILGSKKITVSSGASIEGFLILESRVAAGGAAPIPYATAGDYTTAVSGYTGTAIYCADSTEGVTLKDLMIIGFAIGVDFPGTSNYGMRLERVLTDCTKGFDIYNEGRPGSQGIIIDCGAAAYAVMGLGYSTASKARAGNGIEFLGKGVWYEYTILERFHTDNHANGIVAQFCALRDCKATATTKAFEMLNTCTVIGGEFGDSVCLYGIYVNSGVDNYSISDVAMQGATNPIYFAAGALNGVLNNYWLVASGTIGGDATAILKCNTSSSRDNTTPVQYTPAMTIGGSSTGITYATQAGTYVLIGNMVFGHIKIVLTDKGASTGAVKISLPSGFPCSAVDGSGGGGAVTYATNLRVAGGAGDDEKACLFGVIEPSGTTIDLFWGYKYTSPSSAGSYVALESTGDTTTYELADNTSIYLPFQYMIDR